MGKTVRQVADELGVSKTAVMKQIANLGLQTSLRKIGNQFAIDEQQETLILKAFQKKSQTETTTKIDNQSQTENDTVGVLVSMLQRELDAKTRQLEEKDRQLAAKDHQIEELTETVKTQAQSINADRQKELAGKLIEGKQLLDGGADPAEPNQAPSNPTRWERLKQLVKGE